MNRNTPPSAPSGKGPLEPRILSIEQIKTLLLTAHTHDRDLLAAIALQLWGGLKRSEVIAGVDIEWIGEKLYFSTRVPADGSQPKRIEVIDTLFQWLRYSVLAKNPLKATYFPPDDYDIRLAEIVAFAGLSPLSEDNLYYLYTAWKKALG